MKRILHLLDEPFVFPFLCTVRVLVDRAGRRRIPRLGLSNRVIVEVTLSASQGCVTCRAGLVLLVRAVSVGVGSFALTFSAGEVFVGSGELSVSIVDSNKGWGMDLPILRDRPISVRELAGWCRGGRHFSHQL